MQRYVMEKLESKGMGIDKIIDELLEMKKNAVRPTPTWDLVTDYGTQFNIMKFLLELQGIYKSKWWINMNFNLSDMLYAPREPKIQDSAEVIQGWS